TGAQYVVAMFHSLQNGGELAPYSSVEAKAKHLGELVGGEAKQSAIAGTLEPFVEGEVTSEDEVATVFHMLQGVMASEMDGGSVFLGKLRSYDPGPVIELLANDLGAKTVSRCLQGFLIGHPEKGVVVFTKGYASPQEFAFEERMAIEVVGNGE